MTTGVEGRPQGEPPKIFARQATGLVRAVPQRAAIIFNYIPAHPALVLSAGLFFAFSLFPGGNFFLALAFDIPLVLAFAYSYGLMASMIPRTGGDYVFVSRVIHPVVGIVSSVCWMVSLFLSNAFFASAFIKVGVAPGLSVIGLVGHNSTIANWGHTLATNLNWQLLVGVVMFLLAAGIMAAGWKRTLRLQTILFVITVVGVVSCGLVALFTSRGTFVHNFNAFAAPHTHTSNTYQSTIAAARKSGVNTNPKFSASNTVPLVGILAIATIYPFISAAFSGELRQARSIRTANGMAIAGVISIASIGVLAAIFLHTFGSRFVTAANSASGLPASISASPTYFFLVSASVGSALVAVLWVLMYAVYWPLNQYCNFMQQSRILFAWAFDGLLPEGTTKLSESGSPFITLIVTVIVSIIVFYWSLHSATFLTVIVYGVLIALVPMMLVGLCAAIVPWRRPDFYRAGATQKAILGVPVVTIAGVCAILAGIFVWYLYLHYPQFGISNKTNMLEWLIGSILGAIVFFYVVRWIRRRQGIRLELAYAEIPPE